MGYEHLFEKRDVALLHDWLRETGELYMDLDRPHMGALNNSVYFIDQLADLKRTVGQATFPEIVISIFREKQYPIRGVVDARLLATALDRIPDHQWFSIVSLGDGPLAPCEVAGYGDCHDELRKELTRLRGKNIRLGQNPFDQPNTNFFERPERVCVPRFARDLRHPQAYGSKNRTGY